MSESEFQLSQRGEQRREEILRLAQGEMRSRRRRRVAGRVVIVAMVMGGIILSIPRARQIEIKSPVMVAMTTQEAPVSSNVVIDYIQTDPTIVDRLALHPGPPRWTSIGDDELLDTMAAAGKPAGIIRIGDEAILLTPEIVER